VAIWLPYRQQFFFNGHAWLASELRRTGMVFRMADNALVVIAVWNAAQTSTKGSRSGPENPGGRAQTQGAPHPARTRDPNPTHPDIPAIFHSIFSLTD